MVQPYIQIQVRLVSSNELYSSKMHSEFVTPTSIRAAARREKGDSYAMRKHAQSERTGRQEGRRLEEDQLAVSKVFS